MNARVLNPLGLLEDVRPPSRTSWRLVLASASPRRQVLVGLLGLEWRVAPAAIDEAAYLLSNPVVGSLNVALAKSRAVECAKDELVLAADTLVVAQGAALGKPTDGPHAARMLLALRGRPHQVLTGVALRTSDERYWGGVVSTRVTMRDYSETDIADYISRGEPFDKAGGYAVQDTRFRPVEGLAGCYLNVIGLPLCGVAAGLAALGVEPPGTAQPGTPPCGYCRAGQPLVAIRSAY